MLKPIIPIDRAPESWIHALIDAGILIVTEDGIKCCEPDSNYQRQIVIGEAHETA